MNKEFNRMQKLAGLLTENMEGTNLDSAANDVYDHFSKMSSSTSTDRRNYIKDTYGLSDRDTEILMMKVTDMMSDGMNENMMGTDLKSVANDVYDHFSKIPSSTSTDRRKYVKDIYSLSDEETEDVMMKVTDMMRDGMGMEEGLKRTIRESEKKKSLRSKIREMILAEMDGAAVEAEDYDPVAEAKKDEEIEDVDIDVSDDEMRGGDNPDIDKIQDLLEQLQNAAEDLGDDKLLTQIGNIITFFTRQHVANADADNMG
jgi:hypothetical protein